MIVNLDLYQTVAVAVAVYGLGSFLRKRVRLFERYCIPAPVIGGIIFALLTLVLNLTGVMTINTDNTMQNVFMTLFFTSVGFTASLKLLKKGGVQVAIFTGLATVMVLLQDVLGVALAKVFGLDPLMGLCTASIPMVGGHGTAASFGELLTQKFGITGASTVAMAAATFGLIMGGIIGGPVAKLRIRRHNLTCGVRRDADGVDEFTEEKMSEKPSFDQMLKAFSMLFVAAGIGSLISSLIEKTGLTFPSYIGAMLAAALMRNLSDVTQKFSIMEDITTTLGNVCLSLFLSMALMSLRLWELADLAGPMVVMLLAQTGMMFCFAYFVVFRVMGRDYEAAIMSSATCGFGLGATPNAIANMQAITNVYGPAPKAFFIVPLVGSLFIDFINGSVLTLFINLLA